MNTGSGKNLNWFWKRWFFDGGFADQAITSVNKQGNGYSILVTSKGTKPVPVDLTITFADGTKMNVHRSVSVWEKNEHTVTISVPGSKRITKVELGSTWVPDSNKNDNVYIAK